jgi:hypothetical protein
MRRKGQSNAEYMLPYIKESVDGQIQRKDEVAYVDLNYVAHKFSANMKDTMKSFELLKALGYCFVAINEYEYHFVGMAEDYDSLRHQARCLKHAMRDFYLEEINRLIEKIEDKDDDRDNLLLELFILKKILSSN